MKKYIIKLVLFFFVKVCFSNSSHALHITGQILNYEDSSSMEFVIIQVFNNENEFIVGTATDLNGFFSILLSDSGIYKMRTKYYTKSSEFEIIGIYYNNVDSVNLGKLFFVNGPNIIHTSFKSISKNKNKRKQTKIIEKHNNSIKSHKDIVITDANITYNMTVKYETIEKTDMLKFVYVVRYEDLVR
jgi:hypothetical protein